MITQERLKEVLHYDPETGIFIRILRTGNNNGCKVGKPVGTDCHGYLSIGIDFRRHSLHRLAWLYMNGSYPIDKIDHINGNKSDNRFCNLREASSYVNMQNIRHPKMGNKSGFLGVHKVRDKWRTSITANGKRINIGYYETPELAYAAYLESKRIHHEGCTI